MARIGVFICHCGTNIAGTVNIPDVVEAASKMKGVVHAEDNKYTCSETGQAAIRNAIKEHRLDRVVVAACSPRMHEKTFRKTISQAGLNEYLLEIANLREHCSWVHHDKSVATAKAIDLVRVAVAKVRRNEPLVAKQIGVNKRALVIGGGIAGIQAAIDIANAGIEVVLVERESSIGGRMAQLDKTFPTLDCSACILTPKMVDVAQHPNIELRTFAEVKKVSGFVGNFEVEILQKARRVDPKKCSGCGVCMQKCPEKNIPSEFNVGIGKRTAIYMPFPQAVPNVPVIDAEHCRFINTGKCQICSKLCPAGAINYDEQDEIIGEKFGAIVVATGFRTFDYSTISEYGAGKYPDVITGLQLERMMSASGPTQGEIIRPSDGKHPKTVVFVSCVGSRDDRCGRPYCSKICCMYQAKHAIMLKEHMPDAQAYIFYIDVRAGGKAYEEFVRRAQDEYGAIYIRGRVGKIYQMGEQLIVRGEDSLLGRPVEVVADLVVLATGVEANEGAQDLAQTLSISYDTYSFLNEAHPKLRPVETNTDGIFLAGMVAGPKDIPDTVSQASAAAVKVCGLFSKDTLTTDPMTSYVNPAMCVGCLLCQNVCPFNAIETEVTRDKRTVAKVNEGVCKGCGVCVGACRGKAITLRGYSDEQLLAEVAALRW